MLFGSRRSANLGQKLHQKLLKDTSLCFVFFLWHQTGETCRVSVIPNESDRLEIKCSLYVLHHIKALRKTNDINKHTNLPINKPISFPQFYVPTFVSCKSTNKIPTWVMFPSGNTVMEIFQSSMRTKSDVWAYFGFSRMMRKNDWRWLTCLQKMQKENLCDWQKHSKTYNIFFVNTIHCFKANAW